MILAREDGPMNLGAEATDCNSVWSVCCFRIAAPYSKESFSAFSAASLPVALGSIVGFVAVPPSRLRK